ncbi:glycosyltransferase family 39 protein, partial [Candidatus Daviesbacteria bacterium]|nr:glycosyltransferase family 39 protein [Candidatus Daviesbacteria bacterium]
MDKQIIFNKTSVLILILALAFILRITGINNNPPSMYGDELTMLLDVNSILHTGFDITGKFLPLNFEMGGGRPVGYGYFSLPFVAIFGPTTLSIRLLSVLSGVGIVFLIYLLGKFLFFKEVGYVAALLTAISPWDLSLSRGGFETHFALFLGLLAVVLFLMAEKRPWFYVISALSFGLSINTYSTYKLSLSLFLPLLLWFTNFKERFSNNKGYLVASALIVVLFILLLIFQALFTSSETRFLNLNIFAQKETKNQITQSVNEKRNLSSTNQEISKLFHNKLWEYGYLLGTSYLNNFSVDFLFLTGDKNPRHNMASSGSLYMAEIFLIF